MEAIVFNFVVERTIYGFLKELEFCVINNFCAYCIDCKNPCGNCKHALFRLGSSKQDAELIDIDSKEYFISVKPMTNLKSGRNIISQLIDNPPLDKPVCIVLYDTASGKWCSGKTIVIGDASANLKYLYPPEA